MDKAQFMTDYFKENDTIRVSCVELQEELREALANKKALNCAYKEIEVLRNINTKLENKLQIKEIQEPIHLNLKG